MLVGGILIGSTFIIILIVTFLGGIISEGAAGYENDHSTLLIEEQEREVLINITNEERLELEGGYELVVKSIDIDGNRVYLELYKDKEMIDSRIIVPANQVDDEFVYSRPGTSNEIRAKLKNSFRSAYQNLATIVGIWQNSEDNPDRILINKSQLIILSSKESIKLEEGYELFIKSMDIEGDKICLELDKDGKLVHEEVIIPPNDVDDIFHYSRAGTSHEILIHFKNVLRTPDQDLVTIDRIWQNSKDN
ncbi:S-layer protein domain-containing protein, partial [Methanothrix soehngenii]